MDDILSIYLIMITYLCYKCETKGNLVFFIILFIFFALYIENYGSQGRIVYGFVDFPKNMEDHGLGEFLEEKMENLRED